MKRLLAFFLSFLTMALHGAAAMESFPKPFEGYVRVVKSRIHIELNADATYVESVDCTYKLLDKQGLDLLRKRSVSFSNSLTEMRILSAYTLKADGSKVMVPRDNYQVQTNSGENGASPILSDLKTKTVIFPDVQVGDSIVFSYQLIQKEAFFPHEFSYFQIFPQSLLTDDVELSISAPDSLPLRVEAHDVKGGETAKQNGRRNWIWHYSNNRIVRATQAPSVNALEYSPRVLLSTFKDYAELANAYARQANPKAVVTDRIRTLANSIARNASDPHTTAEALYDWVAQNIRYESNTNGVGSVVPHDLSHILDNKIGDCKDHALLFQALLAAKHIDSTSVLINSTALYHLPELPVFRVFNHVITYIPSLKLYADSTSEKTPFGMLPTSDEGKPVIHVSPFDSIRHTPPTDNAKNWAQTVSETTYNEDGSADGTIKTSGGGPVGAAWRHAFQHIGSMPSRELLIGRVLEKNGLHGNGEYTSFDNPARPGDSFHFELKFHIDNAVDLPGPGALGFFPPVPLQSIPIAAYAGFANIERPRHDFPCSGGSTSVEVIAHMPKNVEILDIPKDVHLKRVNQSYDSVYRHEGSTVTSKRVIVDTTPPNVCSPGEYDDSKSQDMAVMKDLKKQFIFK